MKIEVYGTGCINCKIVEKNARKAIKESGADVEVVKIQEMDQIIAAGITETPGLGIDGKIMSMGTLPSVDEIKKWILSD